MKAIIAIDDTPMSTELLNALLARQWPVNTQVKVLTVLPPIRIPADGAQFEETFNAIVNERKLRAGHFCERVRGRILTKDPHLMVHFDIREGAPAAEIINAAAEWGADKIYVGSHNKDFSGNHPLGSVSQTVAIYAPCSVEIVRSKVKVQRKDLIRATAGAVIDS